MHRSFAYLSLAVVASFIVVAISFYGGALPIGADARLAPRAIASQCAEGGPIGDQRSNSSSISRSQFIWEVLNAQPSSKTSEFRSSPGSYLVVKTDLVAGITEASFEDSGRLEAAFIVGPQGLLWTYHIIVVTGKVGVLRFVHTVFSHGRITSKSTGEAEPGELAILRAVLARSEHILRSGPTVSDLVEEVDDRCWGEFNYDFLAAFPQTDAGIAFRVSSLRHSPDAYRREVLGLLQKVIEPAVSTH